MSNVELALRGMDGRERQLLVNVAFDGDRLTSVAADVTDLRAAAADRERLEAELRHAQKMDAVGRLAGGIAHDFNNLLTAIVGFAGLLEDAVPVEGEDRQSLDGIRQAAGRAGHLTQSLLAFSRKQVLQRRKVDVREIVRGPRRIIGEDSRSRLRTARTLVVEADAGQLEQVLVNLGRTRATRCRGGASGSRRGRGGRRAWRGTRVAPRGGSSGSWSDTGGDPEDSGTDLRAVLHDEAGGTGLGLDRGRHRAPARGT
ncbi:MAG: histidine kinase dimerization/phospho-acceptor domain-containing protein [Anaeromyxobacter sp.]